MKFLLPCLVFGDKIDEIFFYPAFPISGGGVE